MNTVMRVVMLIFATINFATAVVVFVGRMASWLNGDTLLSWIQSAVSLLHFVIGLLCIVLYQLLTKSADVPSPATDHRGQDHDHDR